MEFFDFHRISRPAGLDEAVQVRSPLSLRCEIQND